MISEALEEEEGVKLNGVNINNLRYADDAALVAYSKTNLQNMLDKLK